MANTVIFNTAIQRMVLNSRSAIVETNPTIRRSISRDEARKLFSGAKWVRVKTHKLDEEAGKISRCPLHYWGRGGPRVVRIGCHKFIGNNAKLFRQWALKK